MKEKILEWLVPDNEFRLGEQLNESSLEPASWFEESEGIEAWLHSESAADVWCSGDPGVGKVRDIKSDHPSQWLTPSRLYSVAK